MPRADPSHMPEGIRVEPLSERHGESLRLLRNKPAIRSWFLDSSTVAADQQVGWVARTIDSVDDLMWVAVDADDCVVGAVALYHIDSQLRHCEFGRLMADPDRGELRGLGRALTSFAIAVARGMGIRRVSLAVKVDNLRAIEIYRNLGFGPSADLGQSRRTGELLMQLTM